MNDNKKTAALTTVQENDNQIVAQESEIVNDYDIDAFLEKRKEFITKVNAIMVEGKDFHVIQGKKSLAKGGAEKIASIFGWVAKFAMDTDTYGMLKVAQKDAFVCYRCYLVKPGGKIAEDGRLHSIGEGRGAAILSKNAGDPNKTIKMAQKSAFIDAVLRASGLSDFFTQDLEDMNGHDMSTQQTENKSGASATPKQKGFIMKLRDTKGVQDKITAKMVDGLTLMEAKKWIDKLLKMPDVEDVDLGAPIDTEPFESKPYVPNHEGD